MTVVLIGVTSPDTSHLIFAILIVIQSVPPTTDTKTAATAVGEPLENVPG